MGFGQGLSGLRAQAQNLDVIGNNIANSATVGFKSSTIAFADVYASSRVGLGTQVAAVNQNFGIGSITSTGGQFDMAIDGANGLFRVVDTSGNVLYTRNGQFSADKEGYIVNAQGHRLTGYAGESTTPTPIRVPSGNINPSATDRIESKVNLDSTVDAVRRDPLHVPVQFGELVEDVTGTTYYFTVNDTGVYSWVDGTTGDPGTAPGSSFTAEGGEAITFVGGQPTEIDGVPAATLPDTVLNAAYAPEINVPGIDFDPLEPASFHHYLPVTVYDSQGNPYQMAQYFTKVPPTAPSTNANTWEAVYAMPVEDPNNPPGAPAEVINGMVIVGRETLEFDGAGVLTSAPSFSVNNILGRAGYTGVNVEDLNITVNYAGSTQFSGDFSYDFDQNGYPTGEYSSMAIAPNGQIVASYTNGETQVMGYLVLANFTNVQGLQPMGGNAWRETAESGQPILGRPGTNSLALIKGQAVEESNVDMGTELVNMIISQRAYQANAQTITTQSEILQTLLNIR